MTTNTPVAHVGRKISRLRELRGMKQEALAEALGISQQAVSKMEQSEHVEDATLERVAKALNVTPATIRNFSEEAAIYNIQNNYEGSSVHNTPFNQQNHHCTFNPLDEIRRLNADKEQLYEALLKSEREKNALLEKVIAKLEGRP